MSLTLAPWPAALSRRLLSALLFGWWFAPAAPAQPAPRLVTVQVTPDHANWQYRTGEKVRFGVSARLHGHSLPDIEASYKLGLETMPPRKQGTMRLTAGAIILDGGTLTEAGFLRCTVAVAYDGVRYEGTATVGFSIDEIKPTISRPDDFHDFWEKARGELAKVPLDARMRPLPESSTGQADVFEVNLQNWGFAGASRLYGILSVPKAAGRHPALLIVPGAGVRGMGTEPDPLTTEHGVIVFKIDIHGLPLTLPPEVYAGLDMGGLRMYWNYNIEHRDRYYYKRAYLGCLRANDFLATLPQFDGVNLLVSGRSQGGALSIVTASLDRRVRYLFCGYPALCDLTGYLHGRAGGWPPSVHARAGGMFHNASPATLATLPYYDVVNFARELRVPGLYSWGFNDVIVPPTSMHAAYNVISAPKEILLYPESGHWQYPELTARRDAWLLARLRPDRKAEGSPARLEP